MDKILKIQSEIGVLSKDKENPFFKSSYLDINSLIAQLLPLLLKHELTVIQPLHITTNGNPALMTVVFDGDKEIINSIVPLPTTILEKQKEGGPVSRALTSQEMGSAITYYRRYALQSLFLIQTQDDDGNQASKSKVENNNEDPF